MYVFLQSCSATRWDLQVTHYDETNCIPEYNYTLCSPDNIIASYDLFDVYYCSVIFFGQWAVRN